MTWEDRIKIKLLVQQGKSNTEIAGVIGKNKSTIGRELKRNSGKCGYRPKQAQRFAQAREDLKHRAWVLTDELKSDIFNRLNKKWSPEQISNRLRVESRPTASVETMYKFVFADKENGGVMWKNLRRSNRSRKRRFPSEERRGRIKDARPISKRGKAANDRKTVGHWERDMMIGADRKAVVLALVDRKSRFNKFIKLNRRFAPKVTAATIKALKGLPVASITNDRGLEFADHKNCSRKLKVKIFFCDAYTSSQRGTNENRIGILRQYFPKKTDLRNISNRAIRKVEFEINNRPMKCLEWKTPYEVMMKKSCTRKW
ncbi:MAG TPA: IS30 family transposase [Bacteriovoracaceae bacterium]|nr:IS30 family transposase [Bacteriovoracaceae bacterium]